jgi:2-dehydro-3-deoxygluconokinase
MNKKVVTFGEIMLRLAPQGFLRFSQASNFEVMFGGSESNVAVSLAHFGIDVDFVSRLPLNDLGKCAMMDLKKHGVGLDNIIWGGDRLGVYYLERGAMHRASKVIYDRACSSMAEIEEGMVDWDEVFKERSWFHWSGITPAISNNAATVCLEAVKKAKEKGLIVSADLNYRSKLWGDDVGMKRIMEQLVSYCDIVLSNAYDVQVFFDVTSDLGGSKEKMLHDICIKMKKKFPRIKKLVTTVRGTISASRNTWSGAMYDGNQLLLSSEYDMTNIVDRVGGGDSFMAGIIYGLLNFPDDNQKALDFAVAASCLKHSINGDANLIHLEEVEKLMLGNGVGRISR